MVTSELEDDQLETPSRNSWRRAEPRPRCCTERCSLKNVLTPNMVRVRKCPDDTKFNTAHPPQRTCGVWRISDEPFARCRNNKQTGAAVAQWGEQSSCLMMSRLLVQIPSPPGWSDLSSMSKFPWARYWTPNCAYCPVGTLHGSVWTGECGKYCKALWGISILEKCYRSSSPFTDRQTEIPCFIVRWRRESK